MNRFSRAIILGLVAALAACGSETSNQADAKVQATTSRDWTQTVSRTAAGGYLMGNPDAPVKLIEFASFSCPHCGEFYRTGFEPLREKYIKTGRVSFEFRSFLLGAPDVPISLLAYCTPASAFFAVEHGLYTQQEQWLGKLRQAPQAELQALSSLPETEIYPRLLRMMGLDQFFRVRGLDEARQQQCLADKGTADLLTRIRNDAIGTYKLEGTPTFVINGETQKNIFDWKGLDAALSAKLG